MRNIIWAFLAALTISCGDDISNVNSKDIGQDQNTELEKDTLNRPSVAMKVNIQKNLDGHFETLSTGNYEAYVEYVFSGSFQSEEEKLEFIKQMSAYDEQGWHNRTVDFRINYFSPLVEDSVGLICMLDVYVESDIIIDESFPQKPEAFESMIKGKYGRDNVTYDAPSRTYHIIGNNVIYGITPKDSIHFTFLSATFTQSPQLARLIPFNTVRQLKIYEKDRP
jgi:hypothetical protein